MTSVQVAVLTERESSRKLGFITAPTYQEQPSSALYSPVKGTEQTVRIWKMGPHKTFSWAPVCFLVYFQIRRLAEAVSVSFRRWISMWVFTFVALITSEFVSLATITSSADLVVVSRENCDYRLKRFSVVGMWITWNTRHAMKLSAEPDFDVSQRQIYLYYYDGAGENKPWIDFISLRLSDID